LFSDLQHDSNDAATSASLPRAPELIYLAGIVGVPWQDLSLSAAATEPLRYRTTRADAAPENTVNWDWLLGDPHPSDGIIRPTDPLMRESSAPRTGTHPATGEEIAQPGSAFDANAAHGHEWNITDLSSLQYSCVFPLTTARECPSRQEVHDLYDQGISVPRCACTDYSGQDFGNPLCQTPNGTFAATQTRAGAFPGLRQLQVLHDFGANSIVTSICPQNLEPSSPYFGYRPALNAIVDRMKERLTPVSTQ
jgi:hypothetical protein